MHFKTFNIGDKVYVPGKTNRVGEVCEIRPMTPNGYWYIVVLVDGKKKEYLKSRLRHYEVKPDNDS